MTRGVFYKLGDVEFDGVVVGLYADGMPRDWGRVD